MQIYTSLLQNRFRVGLNSKIFITVCILFLIINYPVFLKFISISREKKIRADSEMTFKWVNDNDMIFSTLKIAETHNGKRKHLLRKEIIVSLYQKLYGDKWYYTQEEIFISQQCHHHLTKNFSSMFSIPCRITADQKYFNVSDAIVFHSRDLIRTQLPQDIRNENQLWVYLQQESPIYTAPDLSNYANIFNWTLTYRPDSDVYYPYGYFIPPRLLDGNSTGLDFHPSSVTNKTGLVAWIVSHCHPSSKRNLLVRELTKYLTVDVFGSCGEPCPASAVDCFSYVASKYKFYLSFENSLCTDYITEKFYKALSYDMVPIVYGGGKITAGLGYSDVAPKDSYIDARSFNNPKELANYIIYLNNNDAEFLKFFEWKKKYYVVLLNFQNRWCSLCQRLYEHVNKVPSEVKWYKDLWIWWNYVEVNNDSIDAEFNRTAMSWDLKLKKRTKACIVAPKNLITSGPDSQVER